MRVLLIEDDRDLCAAVGLQLEDEGYRVDLCHSGEEGLLFALQGVHDLIVLDRMLPEVDGLTILSSLRKKGVAIPVILVTAMNGIRDRIDGLDAGADDYLVKPFAVEELKARIRALSRRPKALEEPARLRLANLELDTDKRLLVSEKTQVSLSRREADLLEYFFRNRDRTLSRDQILSRVWGPNSLVEDGNLDNYIHFLRRRLKAVESRAAIKTIHGVGYRLEEEPHA